MSKQLIGIIEIPKWTNNKYELKNGELILDRVVKLDYPANYGFIPNTLCEDGDPIDIFVISENPIQPLAKVKLELLGVIKVVDKGENDPKIIAKIASDKYSDKFNIDLYTHSIINFLSKYKEGIKIKGHFGKKEAFKEFEKSIDLFAKNNKK
jgi:inorganic pyrophosphatase